VSEIIGQWQCQDCGATTSIALAHKHKCITGCRTRRVVDVEREEIVNELNKLIRDNSYIGINKNGVEAILSEGVTYKDCLFRTAEWHMAEIKKAKIDVAEEIKVLIFCHKDSDRVVDVIGWANEIIDQNKE